MGKIFFTYLICIGITFSSFLFAQENPYSSTFSQSQTFLIPASFQSIPQGKTKICLNMIVRNESKIIERCLNSVKDFVDCISICDTGSTDNTIEIIQQFMKKTEIPGKVHQHVWKNFGHNRTLSAEAAKKTLEELNFPLSSTYLLFLDADMILEYDPSFKKESLIADAYLLVQKNNWLSYYNTRLVRASLPWKSKGVTHEYWDCDFPHHQLKLESLKIDDREDGGCKSDKFERDVKLLLAGLQEEPKNERYMFYLAQSYKCLRNFDEAIKWYKARIKVGGWIEEVWYSKLMLGEIYEEMNSWDDALHWYLEAYQSNPERAESLKKIATYYRIKGKHDLAYLFAKHGSRIPYPKNQYLFISHPVYHYQFDEEISIAAYYIPVFKEEGFAAADRLSLKKEIPIEVKKQSSRNLLFYVQPLPNVQFQVMDDRIPTTEKKDLILKYAPHYDLSGFYHSADPIEWKDGYLALVYEIVQVNDQLHHLHRFLTLDKDFYIQKITRPFIFKQKGIENCGEMTLNLQDKECLIPVSVKGRENWLCSIDLEILDSLLQPLP